MKSLRPFVILGLWFCGLLMLVGEVGTRSVGPADRLEWMKLLQDFSDRFVIDDNPDQTLTEHRLPTYPLTVLTF